MLPADFGDYAWEVEAKGVLMDVLVPVGDREVEVSFYDPVRLVQDLAEEMAQQGWAAG